MTSAYRTAEGARPTAGIAGETQHWVPSNGGTQLDLVLRRNLTKSPGGAARLLAISNAHLPGEDSVAETWHEAWLKQQKLDTDDTGDESAGILLDTREPIIDISPEALDVADRSQMLPLLAASYGDSHWTDLDRTAEDCADPDISRAHVLRFYGNLLVAGDGAWMDPSVWEAAYRDQPIPDAGEAIAVGFDGSRNRDSTAIVGTHMATGYQWILGVWQRDYSLGEDHFWEVPADEVHDTMARIFSTWVVARCYCDPAFWTADVDTWAGRWDSVAAWWMTGEHVIRNARATTAYREALNSGDVTWGGPVADVFTDHVTNAVERPVQGARSDADRLHTIAKPGGRRSRRRIDVAIAAILSWTARGDAIAGGWTPPPRRIARSRSLTEARREKARKEAEADTAEPPGQP